LKLTNVKQFIKEKTMRKLTGLYLCAVLVLPVLVFASCAGGASFKGGSGVEFKDVQGKEWTLQQIKSQGKTVTIDRKKLEANNMSGAFTISFEEDRVSGVGAPNRYFGPYTVSSNNTVNIGLLANTMMAAFYEPEELKENEFLGYLSRAKHWDIRSKKLQLYSANNEGADTVLVFGLK
jgi:heat shock protein HslJ